jgi:hypothetical protein
MAKLLPHERFSSEMVEIPATTAYLEDVLSRGVLAVTRTGTGVEVSGKAAG